MKVSRRPLILDRRLSVLDRRPLALKKVRNFKHSKGRKALQKGNQNRLQSISGHSRKDVSTLDSSESCTYRPRYSQAVHRDYIVHRIGMYCSVTNQTEPILLKRALLTTRRAVPRVMLSIATTISELVSQSLTTRAY